MLSAMEFVPGAGVDFAALARIVVLVLVVYIFASIFGWLQARILNGIVQRAMHRLRMQVEDKIHRLPLSYFDRVQRGELLSRVTNDVDNIGQTMQQTLSQVVTSLLTVIGVLVMMFIISPLLAMIALDHHPAHDRHHGARGTPVAEDVRRAVEGHRHPERARRGDLLGPRRRQDVRSPEGGRSRLPGRERRGLPGQLRRPVPVGHHHARDDVHRKPRLRRHRRRRRTSRSRPVSCRSATCRRSSSTPASSPSR